MYGVLVLLPELNRIWNVLYVSNSSEHARLLACTLYVVGLNFLWELSWVQRLFQFFRRAKLLCVRSCVSNIWPRIFCFRCHIVFVLYGSVQCFIFLLVFFFFGYFTWNTYADCMSLELRVEPWKHSTRNSVYYCTVLRTCICSLLFSFALSLFQSWWLNVNCRIVFIMCMKRNGIISCIKRKIAMWKMKRIKIKRREIESMREKQTIFPNQRKKNHIVHT